MVLRMFKYCIKLLLIMGLVTSCTKDGKNITVQGRVYNPVTGEGISDCEIRLVKESLELPGGNKTVLTVYPDANGYFELNHTSISALYVCCFFYNEKYAEIGWIQDGQNNGSSLVPVKRGKFTYLDCQAVTYSMVSTYIENINCAGPADQMQFRFKTQFDDDYLYWSPIYTGCYSNTFVTQKMSVGWRYYETMVTRSGVTTYVYDTVFVTENGITNVEILY